MAHGRRHGRRRHQWQAPGMACRGDGVKVLRHAAPPSNAKCRAAAGRAGGRRDALARQGREVGTAQRRGSSFARYDGALQQVSMAVRQEGDSARRHSRGGGEWCEMERLCAHAQRRLRGYERIGGEVISPPPPPPPPPPLRREQGRSATACCAASQRALLRIC